MENEEKVGKTWLMAAMYLAVLCVPIYFAPFWGKDTWNNISVRAKGGAIFCYIYLPIAILHYSRYVGLTMEGINCYLLGIKYRFIPWEKVVQVGVGYGRGKDVSTAYIIVTPKGCRKYQPGRSYDKYIIKNWRKVLTIHDAPTVQPVLEKYYGPLNYGRLEVKPSQKE